MKTNRGAIELNKFFQSLKDGAKLVGVGQSQFSLLLSGKRMPSIEVAAQIEKHWGVPCRYWTEEVTIHEKKLNRRLK
jgi:transcriptional regulator with XRE-family HTH domain